MKPALHEFEEAQKELLLTFHDQLTTRELQEGFRNAFHKFICAINHDAGEESPYKSPVVGG